MPVTGFCKRSNLSITGPKDFFSLIFSIISFRSVSFSWLYCSVLVWVLFIFSISAFLLSPNTLVSLTFSNVQFSTFAFVKSQPAINPENFAFSRFVFLKLQSRKTHPYNLVENCASLKSVLLKFTPSKWQSWNILFLW